MRLDAGLAAPVPSHPVGSPASVDPSRRDSATMVFDSPLAVNVTSTRVAPLPVDAGRAGRLRGPLAQLGPAAGERLVQVLGRALGSSSLTTGAGRDAGFGKAPAGTATVLLALTLRGVSVTRPPSPPTGSSGTRARSYPVRTVMWERFSYTGCGRSSSCTSPPHRGRRRGPVGGRGHRPLRAVQRHGRSRVPARRLARRQVVARRAGFGGSGSRPALLPRFRPSRRCTAACS